FARTPNPTGSRTGRPARPRKSGTRSNGLASIAARLHLGPGTGAARPAPQGEWKRLDVRRSRTVTVARTVTEARTSRRGAVRHRVAGRGRPAARRAVRRKRPGRTG